jgi:hypothetical protein
LDAIKEVTQVVEVVDGTPSLVPANISALIKVGEGYVFAEVKSQVTSIFKRLLKGRDFNSPLWLSDVYGALESLPGLTYVNIVMSTPVNNVMDGHGNLVSLENQIVTEGTITILDAAA